MRIKHGDKNGGRWKRTPAGWDGRSRGGAAVDKFQGKAMQNNIKTCLLCGHRRYGIEPPEYPLVCMVCILSMDCVELERRYKMLLSGVEKTTRLGISAKDICDRKSDS